MYTFVLVKPARPPPYANPPAPPTPPTAPAPPVILLATPLPPAPPTAPIHATPPITLTEPVAYESIITNPAPELYPTKPPP